MASSVRVELPAYSHSFSVQVSPSATVFDLKAEIERVCPGGPRVDGQRIIWRGRILRDDEQLEGLWKVSYLKFSLCPVVYVLTIFKPSLLTKHASFIFPFTRLPGRVHHRNCPRRSQTLQATRSTTCSAL
jgi:hypothetical protein